MGGVCSRFVSHQDILESEQYMAYNALSKVIEAQIASNRAKGWQNPYRALDDNAIRRDPTHDKATLWRPAYVRDAEKILHSPYFNRLSDKTQVFSLYKNDDLTRRSLHVQLVSRTARSIGAALGLNTDLIEAVALGHDIGHTPFGHMGERFLSELFHQQTGLYFDHNVHSVRVLDGIFRHNLTLQTLSGILCHNGEFEQQEYRPSKLTCFEDFDGLVASCRRHDVSIKSLVPSTLEGCVVRISDMLAYVGRDRQDAERAADRDRAPKYSITTMGSNNAEIINNVSIDLIENSYGKDYLKFSDKAFDFLSGVKRENYELIYGNEAVNRLQSDLVRAMFERLYERLLHDLENGDSELKEKDGGLLYVYRHHLNFIKNLRVRYKNTPHGVDEDPNQIVVDYIASMTDDYFVDLHNLYFPDDATIEYMPYFKGM